MVFFNQLITGGPHPVENAMDFRQIRGDFWGLADVPLVYEW